MARRRYQAQSFDARTIPEIASGYFWRASLTSGFGTTGFRVLEGNGHSTFDLVQATVANQPTVLTENGGAQFRMRKLGDNPSSLTTGGAVTAGWSGATYIGMWLRLPVDLTGTNNLFQHASALFRFSVLTINGTPDLLRINLISAVQAFTNSTFSTPFADLGWHWIEVVFDPLLVLGGSANTDFAKAFSDLVALSPIAAGAHPTTLADPASSIRMSNTSGGSANNPDVTDWAACYYANGIPSLANRKRLANLDNPTGIAFAA